MVAAERAVDLEAPVQQFVAASDPNLSHWEGEVQRQPQERQRRAVEAAAQAKAEATPPCCPVCHQPLRRLSHGHQRTFRTRLGPVSLRHSRGRCRRCRNWRRCWSAECRWRKPPRCGSL